MNDMYVSVTPKGTKQFPLHAHKNWEIMYYTQGNGHLATARGGIPFCPGTIIIVPPGITHGSVSDNGFVNISIGGDFHHLLMFEDITVLQDTESKDGEALAKMLLHNSYKCTKYTAALCTAYIQFLLENAECENTLEHVLTGIVTQIRDRFADPALNVTALLRSSGYAEDYIRAAFKKFTSLTPIQFLTKTRIDHAEKMLEIYGKSITVTQLASACGFTDSIYFSKRFKQLTGISPDAYKNHPQ